LRFVRSLHWLHCCWAIAFDLPHTTPFYVCIVYSLCDVSLQFLPRLYVPLCPLFTSRTHSLTLHTPLHPVHHTHLGLLPFYLVSLLLLTCWWTYVLHFTRCCHLLPFAFVVAHCVCIVTGSFTPHVSCAVVSSVVYVVVIATVWLYCFTHSPLVVALLYIVCCLQFMTFHTLHTPVTLLHLLFYLCSLYTHILHRTLFCCLICATPLVARYRFTFSGSPV